MYLYHPMLKYHIRVSLKTCNHRLESQIEVPFTLLKRKRLEYKIVCFVNFGLSITWKMEKECIMKI